MKPSRFRILRLWRDANGDDTMAMTMTGEVQLPAARGTVWATLNDPGVLKACIPGCEQLDKLSRPSFTRSRSSRSGR